MTDANIQGDYGEGVCYFSIIYFKIAYRLSTGIKISDLEIARITLNGLMTADARHLCGS